MAYAQTTTHRNSLIEAALAAFREIGDRAAKRKSFRRTRNELSALSDHNLADLGLTRAEITRVAMEASIGTAH